MPVIRIAAMLVALVASAAAQTVPTAALVISNSAYAAFPKLATCDMSANLVGAVLSRAGFKVVRQNNLSNARLGTAIAALGEDAAATPGSRALIYVCSYAVSYSDRLFIVPSEATLEREPDVLSQGIVARLLMSSVAGPGSAAGLVLMDVVAPPGKPALEFSSMLRASDASHGGLVAAGLSTIDTAGPAPLAAALAEAVGRGPVEVSALLTRFTAQPALKRALLTLRPPTDPSWLIGGPEIAPTPTAIAPPPPVAAAPLVPIPIAPPAVVTPTLVTPPAPGAASGMALAEPNPAERRRVQLALSRLGYYRGRVDGVFAIDTANAIRQFQRESAVEPTGKLTIKQMDQLLQ